MAADGDPGVPEFAHYDDYGRFARRTRMESRFATDPESRAFLAAVLATASPRARRIKGGSLLYRAQLGIEEHERTEEDGEAYFDVSGHGRDRMVPKAEFVRGGRANAAGIAFLYLASKEITAISEVRPWIGASVSVAQFRVGRDLRVLDLSAGHGEFGFGKLTFDQLEGKEPISPEKMREVVWTDIDVAFSRPVSRSDDGAEYAPTQVLAEAFRGAGYEAIAYRSKTSATPATTWCCSTWGTPRSSTAPPSTSRGSRSTTASPATRGAARNQGTADRAWCNILPSLP